MYALAIYGFAIGTLGLVPAANLDLTFDGATDRSPIVLVQGSSGTGTSSTGEFGKQSSKSDQPMSGRQSFGGDQPQSGDFAPNPSAATKSDESPDRRPHKGPSDGMTTKDQQSSAARETGASGERASVEITKLSARNQFQGTITKIVEGQAMAEVSVKVGDMEMVAAITKGSVENLGLKVNDPVMVVVKSTDVIIGK